MDLSGRGSRMYCVCQIMRVCVAHTLLSPGVSAASQRGLGPIKGNTGYTDWALRDVY